jgi:hypothetical protein
MAKCADLLRLQQEFNEAEVSWHLFRVPSVVTGIAISSNTEGDRKKALSIRNSAADDIYSHQKTCRSCLNDRTKPKK